MSEGVESIGSMEVDKKLLVVEGECSECGRRCQGSRDKC
jgi:hypothetical protein